jgi:TonB-linked SusC/RagA family outer membrane protein
MNFNAKVIPKASPGVRQILLAMKLTAFMMIAALTQLSAKSFSQNVTIHEKNTSIEKVLSLIEKQTNYHFLFDKLDLPKNSKLDVNVNNATVEEALNSFIKSQSLTYKVFQQTIVLRKTEETAKPAAVIAQKIQGTVTDSKGEALPGVTIRVKNATALVTVTDINGKYTINVPDEKAVLVFTYVGFDTKEEVVGSRTTINVTLADNVSTLNDVLVTGYGGTAKKRDLTGAITTVNAEQIKERQPINLYDALQGQAAGVLVMNDSGEPGAEGTIQIRGASTFSTSGGNTPLYVIDGVIATDAAAINPNDIESIEILKDAASSSIYGARAANGVILITTKRGKEGKPRLDVQYAHVFGKISHLIAQANSADLRLWRKIQSPASSGAGTSTDSLNPAYNSDNFLEAMLLGNVAQKNDLKFSMSGGQKGLTYYGSLNYLDDRGIALNTSAKRGQSRINVDFQATPKLKYSTSLSVSWTKNQNWSTGGSLNPVFDRPNNLRVYLPDGSLTSYTSTKRNPIANVLLEKNETQSYRGQFNNTLDYTILPGLRITGIGNAQLDNSQNIYFQPQFLDDNGNENRGKNELDKTINWQLQAFLNYNKTIAKNHTITGLLGWSAERSRYDDFYDEAIPASFISEKIYVFNGNNIDITKSFTSASAHSTQSVFGRLGYSYKGRYILSGTFRRDGSSRFGPESKWGNFFSGSVAWRFSDEKFMSFTKSFLDDGKLRASVGQQGNDGIPNYESYSLINFDETYNLIGGSTTATKLGNNSIQWENTVQQDYGLDLTFLKGRLGFTVDYYVKATNHLLADQQLPKETGFNSVRVNVGDIQNKGMEFSVNGTPVMTKSFKWSVIANVSFQRGIVKSLANHQEFVTSDNKHLIQEGGRLGNFYGWHQLGIYRWDASNAYDGNWNRLTPVNVSADGKTAEYYTTSNGQKYTGTIHNLYGPAGKLVGGDTEWENANRDSLIDDGDRKIIGNATPKYFLGLGNTFTYKGFSLSFNINATVGGQVYNAFAENLSTFGSSNGTALPLAIYTAWRKQGDIALYPYFPYKDTHGDQKKGNNSFYLEDGTFIRLASARINYSVPAKVLGKFGIKGLNAYVYGINLLTFTNYTGFDPEFSSDVLSPGVDGGKYPKRREFGLGLNVTL